MLTFLFVTNIIIKIKIVDLDPLLDTFDDFVDDLLSSDVDLLKAELDFLIIQHLFQSLDLQLLKNTDFQKVNWPVSNSPHKRGFN